MVSAVRACSSSNHLEEEEEEFSQENLDHWKKSKAVKQLLREARNLSVDKMLERLDQVVSHNFWSEEQVGQVKFNFEETIKMRDLHLQDAEKCAQQKATLDKLLVSLQKSQKKLLEENRRITEEENQRRQEIAKQVQSTISDVKGKMEEQAEERLEQARESEALRQKFRSLVDQYEEREKDLASQQQRREEEVRQLEVDLQRQEQKAQIDLQRSRSLLQANKGLQQGELQLRAQLKQYGEKLVAYQKTLNSSHQVFQQYKQELTKLKEAKKKMDLDREKYLYKATEIRDLEATKSELEDMCRALRNENERKHTEK